MQSYTTVNDMYRHYSLTRDPALATEGVALLWNNKIVAMKALPEPERQRKINKLLDMADQEPSARFGQLVRSVASGAGAPPMVDAQGILRKSRMSQVLMHETGLESMGRVLDPVGKVANGLIDVFMQKNALETPVAVRVRQRISRVLMTHGLPQQFDALLRDLNSRAEVSIPALWDAVGCFDLPMNFLDTEHMVSALAAFSDTWLKQNLPAAPAMDQRTMRQVEPARLLLRMLAATRPGAFPRFEDYPGLEDDLALRLHREVANVDKALADLRLAGKLADVYTRYANEGSTALDAFRWLSESEKKSALAYCALAAQVDSWQKSLEPQMNKVVQEETQARWTHRIARNPADIDSLRSRAHGWVLQNKPTEALGDLSRAADLQPNAANLRDYAVLLSNAGRYAEAEAQATLALSCVGINELTQARLYALRADLRIKLQQPLQAWGDAARGSLLAPADGTVHQALDAACAAEQAAWSATLPSLGLDRSALVQYVQAHELMKLGRWDAAMEKFAAVLQSNPEHPQVRTSQALVGALRTLKNRLLASLSESDPHGGLAGNLGVVVAPGGENAGGAAAVVDPQAA